MIDYYRMRAIFEPYHVRLDPWPGEANLEKNGLPRVFDLHLDTPDLSSSSRRREKSRTSRVRYRPACPRCSPSESSNQSRSSCRRTASLPVLLPFVLEDQLRAAAAEIAQAKSTLEKARGKREELRNAEPPNAESIAKAETAFSIAELALAAAEARPPMLQRSVRGGSGASGVT